MFRMFAVSHRRQPPLARAICATRCVPLRARSRNRPILRRQPGMPSHGRRPRGMQTARSCPARRTPAKARARRLPAPPSRASAFQGGADLPRRVAPDSARSHRRVEGGSHKGMLLAHRVGRYAFSQPHIFVIANMRRFELPQRHGDDSPRGAGYLAQRATVALGRQRGHLPFLRGDVLLDRLAQGDRGVAYGRQVVQGHPFGFLDGAFAVGAREHAPYPRRQTPVFVSPPEICPVSRSADGHAAHFVAHALLLEKPR